MIIDVPSFLLGVWLALPLYAFVDRAVLPVLVHLALAWRRAGRT